MEPAGKIPGVIFAPEVNCYKCPLLHTYPQCGIACVEYIEHMIANESDVAAVIVEPVVGDEWRADPAEGIHATAAADLRTERSAADRG
jgi:taurine---2-oxoglutarate transaminase